jgi:hypothetical protein
MNAWSHDIDRAPRRRSARAQMMSTMHSGTSSFDGASERVHPAMPDTVTSNSTSPIVITMLPSFLWDAGVIGGSVVGGELGYARGSRPFIIDAWRSHQYPASRSGVQASAIVDRVFRPPLHNVRCAIPI